MNPQELRIGNWVHHKAVWSYRQPSDSVRSIEFPFKDFDFQWSESDWYALGECTLSIEDVSTIPLTKEWLLRFGFKKHGSDDGTDQWWLMEKSSESYTGEICLLSLSWHCHKNFFFYQSLNHKIHHVHQLQNLVNVLTGKELILKPEKETV